MGANVTTLALGDAVMADTGVADGGGMAQYVTVNAAKCCKKPKNLSFVEAAAFPHAGLIAYQTLVHDLQIDVKDETNTAAKRVLITGGHSGVGSIAIQAKIDAPLVDFSASFFLFFIIVTFTTTHWRDCCRLPSISARTSA